MAKQEAQNTKAAVATQPEEEPLRQRVADLIKASPERRELIQLLKTVHGRSATGAEASQVANLAAAAMQTDNDLMNLRVAVGCLARCRAGAEAWPQLSTQWDALSAEIAATEDALGSAGSSIEKAPIEQKYNSLLRERLNQRSEYARVRALTIQLEGLRADGIA